MTDPDGARPAPGQLPDLTDLLRPSELTAYVHAPLDGSLDLDVLASADEAERWSHAGEATAYLARDLGVLAAEWARHLDPASPASARPWRLRIRSTCTLDLGHPAVRDRLQLPGDPGWILQRGRTRALGSALRAAGGDALLVPSAAMLDRPDRGNLVVMVGAPTDMADRVIGLPQAVGTWTWALDQASSSG